MKFLPVDIVVINFECVVVNSIFSCNSGFNSFNAVVDGVSLFEKFCISSSVLPISLGLNAYTASWNKRYRL